MGELDRSGLLLQDGAEVDSGGRRFVIMQLLGFDLVVARDVETQELRRLAVVDLNPVGTPSSTTAVQPDLAGLDERDWAEARRRLELIGPLLDGARCPRAAIVERARGAELDASTLYRWARAYRASGLLSSLLPYKPSGGRGKSRLPPAVEQIVTDAIAEHFLTRQQRTARSTSLEVARRCRDAKLPAPNPNTVRLRIAAIPNRERLGRRSHRKAARDQYSPRPGVFDSARQPLDLIQIDHTKLDIIVVDEEQRLPIGRPWITLAIDVYSRMVAGFYISLDPPGAIGTGLCIAHAVLPKEARLAKLGVAGNWPCFGLPSRIHLDNAKEFHGEMLRRACEQYGIALEYRPVAQPHMGGHIERLLGTLMRALHELPGATFSRPEQRGQYDSEARAAMTLLEVERWLTEYIVGVYHAKQHRGIHTTPLHHWTNGMIGDPQAAGPVMRRRPVDEERFRLDFLPFVERTIQPYGIAIDGIRYYGDVLRSFIGASEAGRKRSFLFRRDPRDISTVYFWDAESQRYCAISYRNTTYPAISLWELREIRRKLSETGEAQVDEAAIFAAYARLREHESRATTETKHARRVRVRRPVATPALPPSEPAEPALLSDPADIVPFAIEELA
jgi:putative transposase